MPALTTPALPLIRALAEPKGLLGGVDQATLVVRRDAEALLGEPALAALSRLHLGNARVSALEDALVQEKKP
jgi:glycine betaine/proline transport system substrate-binding protein